MQQNNNSNEPKEFHQKMAYYALISFFSLLLAVQILSFLKPELSETTINIIVLYGSFVFFFFVTFLINFIFIKQGLFSKNTPKSDFLWVGLLNFFLMGGTILMFYLALNPHLVSTQHNF